MIDIQQPSSNGSRQACCLPASVRRRGTSLLNQQFWLWGQDIRRQDGNLLLDYGFERARPPEGVQGSRCYALRLGENRTIALWGFGLFLGERVSGGLYLSRFNLSPLLSESWEPPIAVWTPAQLPPLISPANADDWAQARSSLVAALRWISAYEAWIMEKMGAAYRHDCLARWSRPVCAADDGAALWLRLAHRCDATMRRTVAPSG